MTGRRLKGMGMAWWLLGLTILSAQAGADDWLARVNGRSITPADLELEAILRRIPEPQRESQQEQLLDALIDQQLIADFVTRKRVQASPVNVQQQVEQLQALIRRRGEDPQTLFERLGIDEGQLRKRLNVSLTWQAYVQQVTTDQQLRNYFDQHRRELDGTRLQARHILRKGAPDEAASRDKARQQLAQLRQQITSGEVTFEEAAAEHSQAPSARQGGDVGFFGHRGTMTADFADAAFALPVGEVSQPVETSFGVHLIEVTDERPGQLSMEDVRPQLLERIGEELWQQQVTRLRPAARIQRP